MGSECRRVSVQTRDVRNPDVGAADPIVANVHRDVRPVRRYSDPSHDGRVAELPCLPTVAGKPSEPRGRNASLVSDDAILRGGESGEAGADEILNVGSELTCFTVKPTVALVEGLHEKSAVSPIQQVPGCHVLHARGDRANRLSFLRIERPESQLVVGDIEKSPAVRQELRPDQGLLVPCAVGNDDALRFAAGSGTR